MARKRGNTLACSSIVPMVLHFFATFFLIPDLIIATFDPNTGSVAPGVPLSKGCFFLSFPCFLFFLSPFSYSRRCEVHILCCLNCQPREAFVLCLLGQCRWSDEYFIYSCLFFLFPDYMLSAEVTDIKNTLKVTKVDRAYFVLGKDLKVLTFALFSLITHLESNVIFGLALTYTGDNKPTPVLVAINPVTFSSKVIASFPPNYIPLDNAGLQHPCTSFVS